MKAGSSIWTTLLRVLLALYVKSISLYQLRDLELIGTQVVAVYIAGEAVGALTQTFIGDKLGRIRFMQLMCIIVTIGTVIQTASINIGMFLAGRVLAGYAVGYVPSNQIQYSLNKFDT